VDGEPEVWVDTDVASHENAEAAASAVRNLFPNWEAKEHRSTSFPVGMRRVTISGKANGISRIIEGCADQRILDTALDAMSSDLGEGAAMFHLSRQAAINGRVAFLLPGERALGGSIRVTLVGSGISEWLERATWHPGRYEVPRRVGDGNAMAIDGEPTEWFDNRGRPTMRNHTEEE